MISFIEQETGIERARFGSASISFTIADTLTVKVFAKGKRQTGQAYSGEITGLNIDEAISICEAIRSEMREKKVGSSLAGRIAKSQKSEETKSDKPKTGWEKK